MSELIELLGFVSVVLGAFGVLLAAIGRLMLWVTRSPIPHYRDLVDTAIHGNPYQAAFGILAHLLRPALILGVTGAGLSVLVLVLGSITI